MDNTHQMNVQGPRPARQPRLSVNNNVLSRGGGQNIYTAIYTSVALLRAIESLARNNVRMVV